MVNGLRSFKAAIHSCIKGIARQGIRLRPLIPLNDAHWAKLGLLKILIQRDIEARYKGSIVGNFWPLLNQFAQLLMYTYVFSVVLKVKLSLEGLPSDSPLTFGMWLFAGLLPWTAFSSGLNQSSTSVISQPHLVKKVVFPLTLLPLVSIGSSFLESTFGLMVLIAFVAFTSNTLHATLWLLPLVWIPQLLLTSGLGFLTAGLTVFVRDVPQTLGVILNLWLYATPIIYPSELIPQPFQQWVLWVNPMTAIAEMYRDIVLSGQINHWDSWAVSSMTSTVIFLGGFWCYRKFHPAFSDVL